MAPDHRGRRAAGQQDIAPVHCIDDRKFRSAVGLIKSDPLPGRRSITAKGSGSAGVERSAAALCGSGSFQAESYQVVRMPGPAARVKRIAPPSKQLNTRELVRASGSSRGGLGSTLGQFGERGDDLIAQRCLDDGRVSHAGHLGHDMMGHASKRDRTSASSSSNGSPSGRSGSPATRRAPGTAKAT